MALDFPNSPTVGQAFNSGGTIWTWDGVKWAGTATSPAFVFKAGDTMTGALALPANPTTALQAATKQYVDAVIPAMPQGRLTLQSGVPVMTTTVTSGGLIFYTPYVGNKLPIYDGANMVMTTFTELTVAIADTTKSPAAIGASKCNDWFVWNDSGTIRVGHGPDWTSDTVRSAGTALVMVNGIWLNNASITNGPAAQRGTYVGTTRSNASSQLNWIFGGAASGGTAAVFGFFNAYNARRVVTQVIDTVGSFAVGINTIAMYNGINNRVNFVCGLQENFFSARFQTLAIPGGGNVTAGVGYNSTTAMSGSYIGHGSVSPSYCGGEYAVQPFGFNYFQAMCSQQAGSSNATFYGNSTVPTFIQAGLTAELWL
jgi:hypothetical protein